MNKPTDKKSLLEFPCEFPIKVIAEDSPQLEAEILAIINKYAPGLSNIPLRKNPSKKGNYIGVTVTITADNQTQLDNIYQALNQLPQVKMTL